MVSGMQFKFPPLPPPPPPPQPMPELVSATHLMSASLPERQVILDPILAQKSLMMLYGPRGLGKTHLALGIAWAVASDRKSTRLNSSHIPLSRMPSSA